jgi:hypothetical protein
MSEALGSHYLTTVLAEFRRYKHLGEGAMEQVEDDDLFATLDEEANSIAVIVKHLAGNLRSRWTDFLTTDGEKPDRDRDGEFVMDSGTTRAMVTAWWEDGWRRLFEAIESLGPDDLLRTVHIRGEPHSVVRAIERALAHAAYHVGQIVLLAKHCQGAAWRSLSIPKGQSAAVGVRREGGGGRGEERTAST